MNAKLDANATARSSFEGLRNGLLNDTLLWIGMAAVPGVALSIARAAVIGWRPLMLLHVVLLASLWVLWLRRRRISYGHRAHGLLAVAWLATIAGLVQLGPVALGGLFAILFALLAIFFLDGRRAWWLIAGNALSLGVVGVAASMGWLRFAVDFQAYAHHPLTWLHAVWTLTAYSVVVALIGWRMVQGLLVREQTLHALAARQERVVANVPGVIYQFLLGRDGRMSFPYLSENARRLFGVDIEALKEDAAPAFALVHPDDLGRVRRSIEVSARDLAPTDEVFRIEHPGHGQIWVERHSSPERLANGDTLWHGFMRDITPLKVAERRLLATLENTPNVAVQWYDADGRVVYWNHASERIYGWTAAAAAGKTLDQLIHTPEQAIAFHGALRSVQATGETIGPEESEVRHRDGSRCMVASTLFMIPGDTGPIFVCMDVDITARKVAERSLRESKLVLEDIFDSMTEGLFVVDTRGVCISANKACLRILGFDAESDVIGREIHALIHHAREDGTPHSSTECGVLLAASAGRTIHIHDEVFWRQDGQAVPVEYWAHPFMREGVVQGSVATFIDITERKAAEVAVGQAKEAAEAASRAKSAFLASMSHELRTPLNAIVGFAQMLEMEVPGPLTPEQREAVGHILGGGRHLVGLINEVLDLARIESGKLDLAIGTVDLDGMIEQAIAMSHPQAQHRAIRISQVCRTGSAVRADASRLLQVLLNLLSNAVKYNRRGGLVTVGCRRVGDMLRTTVTDTGPGIPESLRTRLFQPFQRLGAEQSGIEGTGIGLVVCKQLVEAMGGHIGYDSEAGTGTCFWVELPAEGTASAPRYPTRGAGLPAVARIDKATTGCVLCIEDNPVNLLVMRHALRQLPGVEFVSAESAEAGLRLARERRPELILMDINLPGMSGLEATRLLKADAATAAIPVIAVSAAAMPRDIDAGLRAGFLAYLTKPVDVKELLATVRRGLARAERASGEGMAMQADAGRIRTNEGSERQ